MLIRSLQNCREIIAGDHTRLRELLHPDKQNAQISYSLAHAALLPGETSTRHSLAGSEVYYILSGTGLMSINEEQQEVSPGDAVYIPADAVQCIKNIDSEVLVFLCIVDPAWQPEDETVITDDSGRGSNEKT
jgi:mannose-6-phosphate isomerase-like protein (cupin superfamily)